MKEYQKTKEEVKGIVQILDEEAVLETATQGLKHLCTVMGMEVMRQLMELDATHLAGEKGRHNASREAYRHGHEQTKVVLDGRKQSVEKPRVRSKNGSELPLSSLAWFQAEDALNEEIMRSLLCGVSTRKYRRIVLGDDERGSCTSKSEVSRRYIASLQTLMDTFFNRPLDDDYVAVMIDGMSVSDMSIIAAMGIKSDGRKQVLGLIAGATENSAVIKDLLADLMERGLSKDTPRLFVLDGAKALRKAVSDTFGKMAVIQRCQVHKKRNVLSYLPQSEQANVSLTISKAYLEFDYDKANNLLHALADNLENRYPNAAASLREGLEETLTVHRLKIPGILRKTLSNTNAMESANSVAASQVRRIANWRDGEMILRHFAAAFLEAEASFRRVSGYREIPFLVSALAFETSLSQNSSLKFA